MEKLVAAGVTLAVDAVTAEVASAFTRAGLRTILLKGSSIISWLYGEHPERYSVDVDLLMAPDQLARAERVLAELGFKRFEPPRDERHAHTWLRSETGPSVDIHRTMVGVGVSAERAWEVLSEGTESLPVSAGRIKILSPPGRALHIALHSAQHGIHVRQSVADLERAVERLPHDLWTDAASLAERLDATPAFAAGLRLVPAGRELADRLELPAWKPSQVALREQTAPEMTLTLNRLFDTPGIRPKVRLALRRGFPPPSVMRGRSPGARQGRIGLVRAYLSRFGWLARHLIPALRSVTAARRQSGGGPNRDL